MSQYDSQVATANRLIQKFGQVVTWRKQTVQADSTQPWKTAAIGGLPTDYQVSIVFLTKGSSEIEALAHLLKGTDVPTGAPVGLMAAVAFTPELTDVIIRDGEQLELASINPLAPGGVVLLYKLSFA